AVPAGARLLQLGAEAPLLTASLVESGFAVTFAETASPEDPEQGPGAARRPIEDLDLGERFDAVLLCSFLVHSAEPGAALRMLGACLRHTADGGSVLVQREPYGAHTLLGRRHPSPDGGCRGGRPGSSHAAHRGPDARRLRVSQRAPGVVPLPAADQRGDRSAPGRGRAGAGRLPPRRPRVGAGGPGPLIPGPERGSAGRTG